MSLISTNTIDIVKYIDIIYFHSVHQPATRTAQFEGFRSDPAGQQKIYGLGQ